MSSYYKYLEQYVCYFGTLVQVEWKDMIGRNEYRKIKVDKTLHRVAKPGLKLAALIFLLLQYVPSYCQVQGDDKYIIWSKEYKLKPGDFRLKFENFQGDIPSRKDYAQGTIDIYLDVNYEKDTMHYSIYTYFDRDQSMTRTNSEKEMAKEQVIFNINELFARKLKCLLLKKMTKKNVGYADRFYNEIIDERNKFIMKEFSHPKFPYEGQNEYLLKTIDSLDKYSAPEGKIILR